MTTEEQIQLQVHVRAHQSTLGCAELKRRAGLMRQADELVSSLAARAMTFAPIDQVQYERATTALKHAIARAERRERGYYGA